MCVVNAVYHCCIQYPIEYQQLDKQLDQLDTVLNAMEEKNTDLHDKTMLFLMEARKLREEQERQNEGLEQQTETKTTDSENSETK